MVISVCPNEQYAGMNMVLLAFNYLGKNDDDCGDKESVFIARCRGPVSKSLFHRIEFTGTFVFCLLQAVSLLYTPKSLMNIYDNPAALKVVLVFAVVCSFVPALLMWCNVEEFETVSHQVEYSNEITMSFIDMVLLVSLLNQSHSGVAQGVTTVIIAAFSTMIWGKRVFRLRRALFRQNISPKYFAKIFRQWRTTLSSRSRL